MKQRERLNNDGNPIQAMVWEHSGRIIVRIYDTNKLHNGFQEPERELVFFTVREYEEWKKAQHWLEPKKVFQYGAFQKVPESAAEKFMVSYVKDDFAQAIIVEAESAAEAQRYIETDRDCSVFGVRKLEPSSYDECRRKGMPEVKAPKTQKQKRKKEVEVQR